MKLSVYAGRTCCILVPDFLPPPPATDVYAPLTLKGFIDEAEMPAVDRQSIKSGIARSCYAIVPETLVDAWTLSPDP